MSSSLGLLAIGKRVLPSTLALALTAAMLISAPVAFAHSASFTGTLADPASTFETTFTVSGSPTATVQLQTWSFGGGVNADDHSIAAGGFDPFVGIFSGTGSAASIVTDASGNPFGTSDPLSNFSNVTGCPPATTVNIGGSVCGDIAMTLQLLPGTYTILLSDAAYIPNAVYDNGTEH